MRLSVHMAQKPDESELSVFRAVIAKLITLQKQLDNKYQGNSLLIDELLSAVDITSMQAHFKRQDATKGRICNPTHRKQTQ